MASIKEVFKECIIKDSANAHKLYIYFPSLKFEKISSCYSDDLIAQIDIDDRTYIILTECIDSYKNVMNKEYKLKTVQLNSYWQRFTDLSFKNRIVQIKRAINSDRKLLVKISDICFWTFMTKRNRRKIHDILDREIEKVNNSNEWHKQYYERDIALQNYYIEHAPAQIEKIRNKQEEIRKFLENVGYTEGTTEERI